jgi:hypothetical protein
MKEITRGLLALNSIEKAKKLNNNSIKNQERTKRKQGKNRVKTK